MANNWDDILAEPIASLTDPAVVAPSDSGDAVAEAPGAWLTVQAVGDISPRPQEAPMTLPAIDSMLQIRLPHQAEAQEASSKLPPSLADQLSLTWAARRRQAIEPEPEPAPTPAPRPAARRFEAPAPIEPPPPVPAWRKPVEAITRVFARQAPPEPATARVQDSAVAPVATPEPRTVVAIAEPQQEDAPAAPHPAVPDLPLTLATPQRRADVPEPAPATPQAVHEVYEAPSQLVRATLQDIPLSQTEAVRAARLEAPITEPPRQSRVETEAPVETHGEKGPEPAEPPVRPSLAPRKGLLAWLLPQRPAEAAPPVSIAGPSPRLAARKPDAPASERRANVNLDPAHRAVEPTLAQALPALPQAASAPSDASNASEPASTADALRNVPPEIALTHLLRNPLANGKAAEADAETIRETLSHMADAPPAAEPARAGLDDDQGESLPAALQQRMEGLLDVPLHEVRIFRGQVSQRLTERMQADAVTAGNQVHVAPGEGNPALPSGRALLAHELTHYAVHRREEEGPAATLSSASAGAAEPAWPQYTGIAPEPGIPSHEAEETLALRVEHAMSRPDAFAAPFSSPNANAAPLPLQHRAQPAPVFVAPGGISAPPFDGGVRTFNPASGGFSIASAFASGPSRNGGGVGMAPWDRMVSDSGDFMSTAQDVAGQAETTVQEVKDETEDFEDNDEMIEKVAEAVMRHMEDKDRFERERRGAFDGTIGG